MTHTPGSPRYIDVHAYWDVEEMGLDELLRQMHSVGIERVILSPPPYTDESERAKSASMYAVQSFMLRSSLLRPVAALAARSFYGDGGDLRSFWRAFTKGGGTQTKVSMPDNAGLLAALSVHDNLSAWYWVNPLAIPPAQSMENDIANAKVAGVKLFAYWHGFRYEDALPVLRIADAKALPVYLLLNFGWLRHCRELLTAFPSARFIFGYGGFPYFDALWKIIKPFPNASIDLTSLHMTPRAIRAAVKMLGAARCLYGSDCPYNFRGLDGRFDYRATIERIERLGFADRECNEIFHGNAADFVFGGRARTVAVPDETAIDIKP